tara:strand:- start:82 stop:564 length:483 start_codon:yes stop_codon:yes gene_type:complete
MGLEHIALLKWDIDELAYNLKLTREETQKYFTDGRRVSFIMERRICREITGGQLAESEGASYDLIDSFGHKWEVRSITRNGIYFCPSYMVGSGRQFDKTGFKKKLADIAGYIISDVTLFPEIPVWKASTDIILLWYERGKLGSNTKISRDKALYLVKDNL